MEDKLNILVLAGGLSDERQVSLTSAEAIVTALKNLGYGVNVLDTATGESLLDGNGKYLLEKDDKSISKIAFKLSESLVLSQAIKIEPYNNSDLVFIALHGGAGEDGTIQALLDMAKIKYTGSNMISSAMAMNKSVAKKLIENEKIPTPKYLLFNQDRESIKDQISNINDTFDFPLIVKPNNSGSTVGLTMVKGGEMLNDAIEAAYGVSPEVLVEQFIDGREITSAVLDDTSYPLVEIIPSGEIYDYDCKYTKGKSQYICPAELSEKTTELIKDYGRRTYDALKCSGLARVDFILDKDSIPWFLELNTLPGMTELSLAPMAAKEADVDFETLIKKICESALKG
ncbi:MAG: D-alanine--D-alanine ligase [candidate division Zixibacteria bacterium]|nr:D-alanine--D-alanine ligase [candidate division Zixibacteria bacterium]